MIDRIYEHLQERVNSIAVNGSLSDFTDKRWETIADLIEGGQGPMIGIWSSLDWARKQNISWVCTLPVDTPFLPKDTLPCLLDSAQAASSLMACAASRQRHHPVIACWHVDLYDSMKDFIIEGGRKIDDFVKGQKRIIVDFADQNGEDPFMNINRPEDLEKAQKIWKEHYA